MFRALGCVALLALGGCATGTGKFVWMDDLTPAQKASAQGKYIIGESDVLMVQVFNHNEMSGKTRVRTDGNVSINLLGDVPAIGKEPSTLAREIEKQLDAKNLAVSARVTVLLDEAAPAKVSVIGEVARPGLYSLESGAGLAEAIASAGGFTDFAHRDRLYVVRRTPQLLRIRFTFAALSRAEGEAVLFRLRSGDTIVVE